MNLETLLLELLKRETEFEDLLNYCEKVLKEALNKDVSIVVLDTLDGATKALKDQSEAGLVFPLLLGNKKIGYIKVKDESLTKEQKAFLEKLSTFLPYLISNSLKFFKTNLKKQEEKLIIENISEAVATTDKNLNILEINYSFLEMTGYRFSLNEIIGKKITAVIDYFDEEIDSKVKVVEKTLLPEELTSEIIKLKILPTTVEIFGERILKGFVFIFKYPKG